MILESYQDAKNKFLSGDYSVESFFHRNNYILEYAYCKLLSGDIKTAEAEFSKIADCDFRADWAKKILQFIKGKVLYLPSYFQIRNFLEIDLNLLINAGQPEFVENIINGADLFYSINIESYKFISRVMIYNNFVEIALYYLMQAKDKFYYDPEMHFMLANCYMKKGEKDLAKKSIQDCLAIVPEYFPAKKLLHKLS